MGPYTKSQFGLQGAIEDDGWQVTEGSGHQIAVVETELLANVLLDYLLNGDPSSVPDFPADEPLGECEEEEEEDDA